MSTHPHIGTPLVTQPVRFFSQLFEPYSARVLPADNFLTPVDLIDRMLVVKPERRYTIDQCLADPWLTQQQPGVNDSTNGLVSGLAGLEVNRRGVTRERTLLSEHAKALRAANHYNRPNPPHSINSPYKREMRPDDNRDPGEFMEMGGKGDQVLFEDNGRDAARAAAKHKKHAEAGPASPSHRKGGKGKGKGR